MPETWAKAPPPPGKRGQQGKYEWERIVARLKERPGEWLMIDDEARKGTVTAIRRRRMTALQDKDWTFEAVERNTDRATGTCQIWMRAERTNHGG